MEDQLLHDNTLIDIRFIWSQARLELTLRAMGGVIVQVLAEQVRRVVIPREDAWGPSVSVLHHVGRTPLADGYQSLEIQMQSGDLIEIEAKRFLFPENHPNRP